MQYSPKLKKAMEDIKKILIANDIAGIVVIHTPGHSEYLNHVTPTYSCAKIGNGGIVFQTSSKHYNGDISKRNKMVADTANMMECLSKVTGQCALNFLEGAELLNKHVNAEHTGGGHSSHEQQNN